jgi:ABC-type uncharacterized transport system ATPase subunit
MDHPGASHDASLSPGATGAPLVEMRQIGKRYGSFAANDGVDFLVRAGEVHGLLGENGAGKSTLMKVLYGLEQADAGSVLVDGQVAHIRSPKDAIGMGIAMVHQELMLALNLSIAENVLAGSQVRRPVIDLVAEGRKIQATAARIGLDLEDPRRLVRHLSVGEAQRVEIVRAVHRGARVLILDEPSSRLTPTEVEGLATVIRGVRSAGGAVIFVTHKLEEVLALCDRVTVLRGGTVASTHVISQLIEASDSPEAELARAMVGRPVILDIERPAHDPGPVALQLEDVSVEGTRDVRALNSVSLVVRRGEIVGLAGVAGNGQAELVDTILGLRRPSSGRVRLFDRDVTRDSPWARAKAGIGNIPEDRKTMGMAPTMTIAQNVGLRAVRRPALRRFGMLSSSAMTQLGRRLMREYDVRGRDAAAPISSLSGGNQQKAILAREIHAEPGVLVVTQPTAGLDVGAIEQVHRRLLDVRSSGTAILLISNELSEVLSLSDRVAVISGGRITVPEPAADVDLDRLGLQMAGVGMDSHGAPPQEQTHV